MEHTQETFENFALIKPIKQALSDLQYKNPTPIQAQAIPVLLKGQDILGCAQTGTGKTAAFALPILNNLVMSGSKRSAKHATVLVLTPTRELALQIFESFKDYGKYITDLRFAVIFGGVSQGPQVSAMAPGVDVLIATPGRLLDLISQKKLSLAKVNTFVLDEADQMLDMGFIEPIKKIIPMLPAKRHNLFFSATMPTVIRNLASTILSEPVQISVTPAATTAEKVEQNLLYVDKSKKRDLLRHLLQNKDLKKVIVFTRTKHGANRVAELLQKNHIPSEAIHGNKSQNARQRALDNFKAGKVRVLIATDIAARGIDVDGISHVINFEIPNVAESYVHRIGRTARAGAGGIALSFCDAEEKSFIRDIERTIGQAIPVVYDHPFHSDEVMNARLMSPGKAKAAIEGRNGGGGHQSRNRRPRRGGGGGGGGQGGSKPQPEMGHDKPKRGNSRFRFQKTKNKG